MDVNARFMRKETYDRLVADLREDGCLTSVPLIYGGGGEYPEGHELVLSGNHRVMGGIDAGIEEDDFKLIGSAGALNPSRARVVADDQPPSTKLLLDLQDTHPRSSIRKRLLQWPVPRHTTGIDDRPCDGDDLIRREVRGCIPLPIGDLR
ncbi:hypothetical protein MOQ72_27190 [Saccharopolyspora sp. K220]|uniref:hypothetical protein n=1 Tax=Saccharopolyspora soli TaxID=2926618 RepID=UPI001F59C524|nr:hypothetical protein [Saccharopolyspora soli]MCI2421134.1 hypothetical protein [Saccharopolyspora soli]